jgi:hypothetical protein
VTLAGATATVDLVTPERAEAYGRIMRVVSAEGRERLEPEEQAMLREAADAIFFSEDIAGDPEASQALAGANDLAGNLVGAERWTPDHAERVLQDLEACGPAQLVRLAER